MKLTIQELQAIETEMLIEVDRICRKNNLTYFIAYGTLLGAKRHGGHIPWDGDADIIIPFNELEKFIRIVRKELPNKFFLDFHDINKYYTATFPRIGLKGYSTAVLHLDVFMYCGITSDKQEQMKFIKKLYKLRKIHFYKINSKTYRGNFKFKYKLKLFFFKILFLNINLQTVRKEFDKLCKKYPIEESELLTNPSGSVENFNIFPKSFFGHGINIMYDTNTVIAPEKVHDYLQHFYNNYMQFPPKSVREKSKRTFVLLKLSL